jgi:uncharacterized protein YcaQ
MLTIDAITARRFILGKQGLWPGRRWRGLDGTASAMRSMEYLQLDPLQVFARSQDLALHSRVLDYQPEMWETAAYQQRKFFDWGGWLATRPMEELPYWREVMQRERASAGRLLEIAREHPQAIVEMRAVLQARGTVSNRDFAASARTKTNSYRGGKDSSLALYYLWRIGEVMTHHRENFERVYALVENVAPPELLYEKSAAEVDRFLVLKEISFSGLSRLQRTSDAYRRGLPFERKEPLLQALQAAGDILSVQVQGWKFVHYLLACDLPLLEQVRAGGVPEDWAPLERTTTEEAVFLAPLDQVCSRGRAAQLFGFEYAWEVYKPEHQRQYGYYTLPVLWGDRLVARFDSKLDRATGAYTILGFWLEDENLGTDEAFAQALGRGFARFVTFLGADRLETAAIGAPRLRQQVQAALTAR